MPGMGATPIMAIIQVAYTFADGDSVHAYVELESSYPDAVDEARATCVRTFEEALAGAVEFLEGRTDDDS